MSLLLPLAAANAATSSHLSTTADIIAIRGLEVQATKETIDLLCLASVGAFCPQSAALPVAPV